MAGESALTIIGNLTADPELRTTGGGATVASFTIASTPRNWNRQTNQFEDGQALFMRCSAWGDMAGHCVQSLKKGMRVIAQGRLRQHSYQAQDGSQRTVIDMTEVCDRRCQPCPIRSRLFRWLDLWGSGQTRQPATRLAERFPGPEPRHAGR